MTVGARRPGHGAVHWLTAQAVVFGVVAALLGVVANAMFLEAYGASWLPLTYVAIGLAGAAVSSLVASSSRRFDLVRIAVVVLGAAAVVFLAAWVVAADGEGAWVSGPLLVLFPVLIQLGFVFIGAQAGRILDIGGIKARFPRIVAGFPVGAVLGGLLAAPLVDVLDSTEGLLLVTALAQAVFTLLVLVTGVRYAAFIVIAPASPRGPAATPGPDADDAPSMRRLLATPFVALILAYQLLSALASQLSDYLVFDRAAAQYSAAEDLARFLAGYTAVMNVVSIAFLVLVAGPLLRRFGLRLGIAANPVVLTVASLVTVVVLAVSGAGSMALLITVSAARILDIALTDGTTRTSINAMYQVLPERSRLAAQATIEGMGVPVAIALSGVLVLGLNALPAALPALVVATVVVSAAWVWVGLLLHRAYGPALLDALRRHRVLVPAPDPGSDATAQDRLAAEELLRSPDPRSARLGLELVAAMAAPPLPELGFLADDPRAEVRLAALDALAATGDTRSRDRLSGEVTTAVRSTDPVVRQGAAHAAGVLGDDDRCAALATLLADESPAVRAAALDAVRHGDAVLVDSVLAAVDDPATAVASSAALRRLGDAALPAVDRALRTAAFDDAGSGSSRRAVRLVRAVGTGGGEVGPGGAGGEAVEPGGEAAEALLLRWVGHHDREVGRVVLERLARRGPASPEVARVLDEVLADDLAHAVRVLTAVAALHRPEAPTTPAPTTPRAPGIPPPVDGDDPLRRALADELVLVRDRVLAGLVARHGHDRLGPVAAGLLAADGPDALALEALEVVLGASPAARVTPVLDDRDAVPVRLARLVAATGAPASPVDVEAVLADLVEDREAAWRSPWLRACAVRAACDREVASGLDLVPARALGDPMVDEELDRIPWEDLVG